MGRKRVIGVPLPKGVERVRAKGRTYYYWNPGRGTQRQRERIRLPDPCVQPEAFARDVRKYARVGSVAYPQSSIGALIDDFEAGEDFKGLSDSTRSNYRVHYRRFKDPNGWGMLPASELTPEVVRELRDAMKETPGMANHMLACGRTLWAWAIPFGYATVNPFNPVKDLATDDSGHIPWPTWAIDFVRDHAPPDLVRLQRLGIMTCQRESDLIRLGPEHRAKIAQEHRERLGIWCRPKKTRKKRKAFCIPLTPSDAKLLDLWEEMPITFTNSRWKVPIDRFRADLYLYSPKGAPYSPTSLRARWHRWLRLTPEGQEICRRWKAWVGDQVRKFEWDIDPEEANNPTIHGLRGTGILVRLFAGHGVDQIANDIGMSRQMVERYMRFRDQVEVAAAGRARLQVIRP